MAGGRWMFFGSLYGMAESSLRALRTKTNAEAKKANEDKKELEKAYKKILEYRDDRKGISTQISKVFNDSWDWKGNLYNGFTGKYGVASEANGKEIYDSLDSIADEINWEIKHLDDVIRGYHSLLADIGTALENWING